MAKSAKEKLDEYLGECRETTDAINEFIDNSADNYKGYAYAAGALSVVLQDAIAQLPKAKRTEMRERLYGMAQQQKNEILVKTIKDTA